ncbi:MAG: hypothetical protein KJO91_12000 [Gammaproteobacteria bacterium]|nr:hypothetical protein [Gammaproteobacteria bacterium]
MYKILSWLIGWFKYSRKRRAKLALLQHELDNWEDHFSRAQTIIADVRKKKVGKDFRSMDIAALLHLAKPEEINAISSVLGVESSSPDELLVEIFEAGTHSVKSVWRMFSGETRYDEYVQIVSFAAKHLDVTVSNKCDIAEIEEQLVRKQFSELMKELTPEKRKEIEEQIEQEKEALTSRYGSVIGGGTAIIVAQASGFGIYLMASTVVGAATSAIGITLPFAFYTGMSQAISVAIGPVGWLALGSVLIHKLGAPKKEKVIPMVLLLASVRARLIEEQLVALSAADRVEQEILPKLKKSIQDKQSEIARLESYSYADDRLATAL